MVVEHDGVSQRMLKWKQDLEEPGADATSRRQQTRLDRLVSAPRIDESVYGNALDLLGVGAIFD